MLRAVWNINGLYLAHISSVICALLREKVPLILANWNILIRFRERRDELQLFFLNSREVRPDSKYTGRKRKSTF